MEIVLLVFFAGILGFFLILTAFCLWWIYDDKKEKEAMERIKKLKPTNEKTIVII